MRETLKDSSFRILGYIETRSSGEKVAMDSNFRILGYYYPGRNVTQDAQFRIIAYCDALSYLIFKANGR